MAALRERFLIGAETNGVDRSVAEEIYHQLAGFAGFGFCKSHAAAFALVAYQTLYLKAYYPAEFFCALLNHQPMGFYPPGVLIGDARRHDVPILQPDINHSQAACTLEQIDASLAIRLGLSYVHGLGEAWQTRVLEQRGSRSFQNLRDFCRRTGLPRPLVENLIRAGAMQGLGTEQRNLLWDLGGMAYQEEDLDIEVPIEPMTFPNLDRAERLAWEYELLGLAPREHVMTLYRETLQARGVLTSRELEQGKDGQIVRVAGMATVRQRPPTAKGHVFITLEDEEGLANLIIRPKVFERYRDALRNAPMLWVEGRLQREGRALSVLVHRAASLGPPASH
jgi:error-prone DNA polymerase